MGLCRQAVGRHSALSSGGEERGRGANRAQGTGEVGEVREVREVLCWLLRELG